MRSDPDGFWNRSKLQDAQRREAIQNGLEGTILSPTQRSLKLLRNRGWTACVVEKYNNFAHVRQDAFGFGDILASHPHLKRIVLIQTTSISNLASRRKKILKSVEAGAWLMAGGMIVIHGWKGNKVREVVL